MSDKPFPDFASGEIDLAQSGNFPHTRSSQEGQGAEQGQSGEHQTSDTAFALDEQELEIPKFLLKNNTTDVDALEEDKFVDRSMKMVQDAVRTLSEDDVALKEAAAVAAVSSVNGSTDGPNSPDNTGGKWKIPMTFGVLAIAVGGFFAYQSGNLEAIASFAQKSDGKSVQTANDSGAIDSDTSVTNDSPAQSAPVNILEQSPVVVAVEKPNTVVKLDDKQYNSLKARLGGEATASRTDNVETASLKRLQVAALVAEQAPPKPKSTRSLDNVNKAANELETQIDKPEPVNPVVITPVKVTPAAPVVKLAQSSTAAEDKLKLLTNNVVNQLNKLKQFEDNPETAEIPETQDLRNSINQLVQQATSQNLDSSAIEGLLQEALENSGAVPQALARADGKLDTRLLLTSVLSQIDSSQVKSSDQNYLAALDDEGSTTVISTSLADAPAASSLENSRIVTSNGKKSIKVEVGDTLSKIAFAVYGDALTYTRIFKANRKQLKNPNLLKVGMVLVLP